ncbi:hypothetical protein FKP32DRAFT_1676277 [Trametes sanguinea]|nr:hypothetical protein FKP32DRAFT_1676277 [Trametes sanguinea]
MASLKLTQEPLGLPARFSRRIRRLTSRSAPLAPAPGRHLPGELFDPQAPPDTISARKPSDIDPAAFAECVPTLLTTSLLPLSYAQRRRDIRERREGFEMSGDPTPFAIRSQALLPLDVAFTRDDIRRRHEGFEANPAPASLNTSSGDDITGRADLSTASILSPTSLSSVPSCHSTASSIYSRYYELPGTSSGAESPGPCADAHPSQSSVDVHSDGSVYSECDCGSYKTSLISTSSFDEESFIRMAETSLGW